MLQLPLVDDAEDEIINPLAFFQRAHVASEQGRWTLRFHDSPTEQRYRKGKAAAVHRIHRDATVFCAVLTLIQSLLDVIHGEYSMLLVRGCLLLVVGIVAGRSIRLLVDRYVEVEHLIIAVLWSAVLGLERAKYGWLSSHLWLVVAVLYPLTIRMATWMYTILLICCNFVFLVAVRVGGNLVPIHRTALLFHFATIGYSLLSYFVEKRNRQAFIAHELVVAERVVSESLLHSLIPEAFTMELRTALRSGGPVSLIQRYPCLTVLFADICGFTTLSLGIPADELVDVLNAVFRAVDMACLRHDVEKIKTVGDAYMCASAVDLAECHVDDKAAVLAVFDVGVAILGIVPRYELSSAPMQCRVGMHVGPAVGGVIGETKFTFDIWGSTVNIASRFESSGVPGAIHMSQAVVDLLPQDLELQYSGKPSLKGVGEMPSYLYHAKKDNLPMATYHNETETDRSLLTLSTSASELLGADSPGALLPVPSIPVTELKADDPMLTVRTGGSSPDSARHMLTRLPEELFATRQRHLGFTNPHVERAYLKYTAAYQRPLLLKVALWAAIAHVMFLGLDVVQARAWYLYPPRVWSVMWWTVTALYFWWEMHSGKQGTWGRMLTFIIPGAMCHFLLVLLHCIYVSSDTMVWAASGVPAFLLLRARYVAVIALVGMAFIYGVCMVWLPNVEDRPSGPWQVTVCWATYSVAIVYVRTVLDRQERSEYVDTQAHQRERLLSDCLLASIFPSGVVTSLRSQLQVGGLCFTHNHDCITVMFADMCGFTSMCGTLTANELVATLSAAFRSIDKLCLKHHVEKIKTVGDAYMCCAGLAPHITSFRHIGHREAASAVVDLAASVLLITKQCSFAGRSLQFRVGVHSGPAVAGIIGWSKFAFDIWGATINTASRFESTGVADKIHLSEDTKLLLGDKYPLHHRGKVSMKGIGDLDGYLYAPVSAPRDMTSPTAWDQSCAPEGNTVEVSPSPPVVGPPRQQMGPPVLPSRQRLIFQ